MDVEAVNFLTASGSASASTHRKLNRFHFEFTRYILRIRKNPFFTNFDKSFANRLTNKLTDKADGQDGQGGRARYARSHLKVKVIEKSVV